MAKNVIVINVDIRETRVALIEEGIITELHIERASQRRCLGDVVIGKVTRVLPGMQAAFVDVGLEKAAFLHVEDLIRPDDFETFLTGKKRHDRGEDHGSASASSAPDDDVDVAPGARPAGANAASPPDARGSGDAQGTAEGQGRRRRRRGRHGDKRAGDDRPGDAPREARGLGNEHVAQGADASDESANVAGDDDVETADESAGDEGVAEARAVPPDAVTEREVVIAATPSGQVDEEAAAWESESRVAAAAAAHAVEEPDVVAVEVEGEAADALFAAAQSDEDERLEEDAAGDVVEQIELAAEDAAERVGEDDIESDVGEVEGDEARGEGEGEELIDALGDAPASTGGQGRSRRRRRRRSSGKPAEVAAVPAAVAPPVAARNQPRSKRGGNRPGGGGGGGGGHGGHGGKEGTRIDKHTPIRDVVREGQEVLVQISKEPISTKGARVTSHVSLPGRYVVFLPTLDYVGVSKRIGSEKERQRLRDAIEAMRPPTGGLIIRTVAEGLTKKQLKADVGYLVRLWGEIAKKREGARAPSLLYQELDIVLRVARDLFGDNIEKIVIDDRSQHDRLARFVEMFMPERVDAVELYEGDEPIFDAYGIEEEISRSLARRVPLPSGGYLIIDEAEALTAIDVNTGRFVGKGSKDHEETILKTNLEAVEEIAYQLRFRNLGGLIVLDLIDMERAASREQVRRRLEELLQKDKAKTSLNRISELGLIEMTRKRTRESLGRLLHEACPYCDGTGQVQAKTTVIYEILRAIGRDRATLPGYTVTVHAHPDVVHLMKTEERAAVLEAEKRFTRRIDLNPRKEYHIEQYELVGR